MTQLRLAHGALLLLLYQVAPLGVQQDSLGRYRISVGYAAGQWEHEQFSCDGQLLSSTPVRHHSAGVQIEAWPDSRVRVTAFGGVTRSTPGATVTADSEYASPFLERYDGTFSGGLIAYEGDKMGVGFGLTNLRGNDTPVEAGYFRVGRLDAVHLRVELMTPDPSLPSAAWGRIGVGFNQGHIRRVAGFMGVGFGPSEYNSKAALVGAIQVPVAPHFTAQLHGLVGPGENTSQWNMGFGVQYDFAR